eukprot:scaffold57294_cov32-Tisochrysis_lutea.AAC.6
MPDVLCARLEVDTIDSGASTPRTALLGVTLRGENESATFRGEMAKFPGECRTKFSFVSVLERCDSELLIQEGRGPWRSWRILIPEAGGLDAMGSKHRTPNAPVGCCGADRFGDAPQPRQNPLPHDCAPTA